nr:MAG TPA: hypothetical protein [Caudoviricetes sp.]
MSPPCVSIILRLNRNVNSFLRFVLIFFGLVVYYGQGG